MSASEIRNTDNKTKKRAL